MTNHKFGKLGQLGHTCTQGDYIPLLVEIRKVAYVFIEVVYSL